MSRNYARSDLIELYEVKFGKPNNIMSRNYARNDLIELYEVKFGKPMP
jgi:hypothetical protein